ncbi:MAG TPA: trypsin-like peptidase domain-containing protein [Flavobacteriales bacterium]|nr:trypsin-like peptidase domain-containing protein [Flavobacteriales bacterium]
MTREELTLQIEKYLDGQLNADEAKKLEMLIVADDKIAGEVKFHQDVRQGIINYYERLQLKNKMAQWEDDKSFPVQKPKKNSLLRPIMAAASISLLITVGGVSLYHFAFRNTIDNKLEAKVTQLSREATKNRQMINAVDNKVDAATADALSTDVDKKTNNVIGTGFMLTADGYVVTNYHLIKGALKRKRGVTLEQQIDGKVISYNASIISSSEKLDFALLKITDPAFKAAKKTPYSISDKNVALAQKIYTLGYPKDDIVYTEGAISSLSGNESDTMFYQLSIISAPGSSGSPIINEKGELVGLLSSKNNEAEGETYCVKMKYILDHIEKLKEKNKEINIKTNPRSSLSGKKLPDQVNAVKSYVFIVKA